MAGNHSWQSGKDAFARPRWGYVVYMQVCRDQKYKRARKLAICAIAAVLVPREQALSTMAGDWNFVMNTNDRWSKQNGSWTGGTDAAEARKFVDYSCRPQFH